MRQCFMKYHGKELPSKVIDFVEKWHYTKSCRSQKPIHVFTLSDTMTNELVGVAIYGQPISRNTEKNAIELRRFCLDDRREKNTSSFFLGSTLRWLRKNEPRFDQVVTFADPNQGHVGTIYKAANFEYDGLEKNNPRIVIYGDRRYHIRQFYQKRNGDYDEVAKELQRAVEVGDAQIVQQERKHRFIYKLR